MRLPRSRRRDSRQSGPLVRRRRRRGGCQRTARRAKAQGKGVGGISKPSRSMSSEPPQLSASQARTGLLDAGSGQGGPAVKIIEADSRSSAMHFTKRITANTLPMSGLITRRFSPLIKVKIQCFSHINVEVKWRTELNTSAGSDILGNITQTDWRSKHCLMTRHQTSSVLLDPI